MMFEPAPHPRVFALPPGADFPRALVDGLLDRLAGAPPETLARVHLVVNTQRMARRISALLDAGGPRLLPRISLISDISTLPGARPAPAPTPPLRRRLMLTRLIRALLEAEPDLAGPAAAFDLAGSLAALLDEMHGEGVPVAALQNLDFGHLSGHWERARAFIGIAETYLQGTGVAPDRDARHRQMVEALTRAWEADPPQTPVIVAGSTGSRGTTGLLMRAVARLPQGALVLPGFDFDAPDAVWAQLADALSGEDHPQYRFARLLRDLDLPPQSVARWTAAQPASPERARVVSLALRPAPYTDAWLDEGPDLPDPSAAMGAVTLVEARSQREEALAIALRLRLAAEEGQTAALVTPDRVLTRQVAAALDRWNIRPDDSAGEPLHLSAPGRFLRQVAALRSSTLRSDMLIALLKHPLAHAGAHRGDHLRLTRDLELYLRARGIPFPTGDALARFAAGREDAVGWTAWIARTVLDCTVEGERPLAEHVADLLGLAAELSAGAAAGAAPDALWQHPAGQAAKEVCDGLAAEAGAGGQMTTRAFEALLGQLLAQEEVRDPNAPEGRIMIWGTLEARVQGAGLVILAGLNEGSWPRPAPHDPWLNRELRHKCGLLVPERQIGLSAHDFQQAIGAPEVWLTRAYKSESAETVPARWLNRLTNLLSGLPATGGLSALAEMRARGRVWLGRARLLDRATRERPAPRPSPVPPRTALPDRISVTGIQTLLRDPYAIYARRVLRLQPLNPMVRPPDAMLRGIVIHGVFEAFVRDTAAGKLPLDARGLIETARGILDRRVPWPVARALWLARIDSVSDWFVAAERFRRQGADPIGFEADLSLQLTDLQFTIYGRADRIDRDRQDRLLIYDYKTGKPPTEPAQRHFDKQLLVEAALVSRGAWAKFPEGAEVAAARYIGLGADPKEVPAPLDDEPPETVLAGLNALVRAYFVEERGFTSRRAAPRQSFEGDYDHLARFGEWDHSATPARVILK